MGTIMVSHLARLTIDDHNRGYLLLAVIYCCLQWPLPAGAHGTGAVHNHGSLFPHCIFNEPRRSSLVQASKGFGADGGRPRPQAYLFDLT
jgi:hypothetical protein